MADDLIAAVDETGATTLLHAAEAALGTLSRSGGGSLGPLGADWSASLSVSGGTVTLAAPDTVAISGLQLAYSLGLTLSVDLSFLDFCLPRVCIPTPWGDICTPKICFTFAPISVPVSFASTATLSADFGIQTHLTGGTWFVDVVIQSVPDLALGGAAVALLTAIGAAISLALLAVPFIGPLLAAATAIITALFGLADVTGLLGPIVSALVAGLTFTVYQQPQVFTVLPAAGAINPAVSVTLAAVSAGVQATDKNELVLSVDI
jgi:hypothetical protein